MFNLAVAVALVLASAFRVQGAGQPIDTPDTVIVESGALKLRGLLWRPNGRGPFPAVLFNHGSGPAADPKRPAILGAAFARHGYVFLYLYRRGAGLSADQGTNSGELMSRALKELGQEARNQLQLQLLEIELSDVIGGLDFLRARSEVDPRRIAVAGHSFGGQLALLTAERDPSVRAAVAFGAAAASWESSSELRARLIAAASRVSAPVFFVHAANDFSVAPGKVLTAEMTRLGKACTLKIYPAVGNTAAEGHDFVHRSLPMWEADVFAFLAERMQQASARMPVLVPVDAATVD
jgi:carboxymethylenebutenolidase